MKKLSLILGDQLDHESMVLKNFDRQADKLIMIESFIESTYVWTHKAKIALFISAMRHFAKWLKSAEFPLIYIKESPHSIEAILKKVIVDEGFTHLICIEPGEWRLKKVIEQLAIDLNVTLVMYEDSHFYSTPHEFKDWVGEKKELRLEYFYRKMRQKHDILMEEDGTPFGGRWNYDDENRKAYPKNGPGLIPDPLFFEPDEITREVLDFVETNYSSHPGALNQFLWPVTRAQALEALDFFTHHRLSQFGTYQDAMWKQTPFGWHSLISSSLNLKLINPREVVSSALRAYQKNLLDIATVEGFIRQIIGWREFIRGIYYLDMPNLAEANFYGHQGKLPDWYWTGETKMNCMKDTIHQTIKYGYAHHIQRLMITGNFALLSEVMPEHVADWYLAIYVDAIEWVELPNVMGMALFANGGRFTSKPYIASGAYVKRMSNYCQGCEYKPDIRYGDQSCPMTNLYWNFLINHKTAFNQNPRTRLMTANLSKISEQDQTLIQKHAQKILKDLNAL